MERKVAFAEGEYYHLYNRGVDKRQIYMTDLDRDRFIKLLLIANSQDHFKFRDFQNKSLLDIGRGDPLVAIGAYVLMPNHFHILVKEINPGGISAFMEKLLTGYSSYFNKRYQRVGALFQGTFKAQHADNDQYLKYLFAYIHLNPIKLIDKNWKENGITDKIAAKKFLREFAYSSYRSYVQKESEEKVILTLSEFPHYFKENDSFENFITEWLEYKDL